MLPIIARHPYHTMLDRKSIWGDRRNENNDRAILDIALWASGLVNRSLEGKALTPEEFYQSRKTLPIVPTLGRLAEAFHLDSFETDILALAAAMALVPQLPGLCARFHNDTRASYITFSLVLQIFPHARWSALNPKAPLRDWQLLRVWGDGEITLCRLSLDESVLHYLMGEPYGDSAIEEQTTLLPTFPQTLLPPRYQSLVEQLTASFERGNERVQLWGSDPSTQQAIAAAACRTCDRPGKIRSLPNFPIDAIAWQQWQQRWQREVRLNRSILVVDARSFDGQPSDRLESLDRWLAGFDAPLLLLTTKQLPFEMGVARNFQVPPLNMGERRELWLAHLGDRWRGRLDRLATQFAISPTGIHAICSQVKEEAIEDSERVVRLWQACRERARPQLDAVATRVETSLGWDDLILPEDKIATLKNIVTYVEQSFSVYHEWGAAGRSQRGLGISALFSGDSGTGKTTAAEIIAKELHLDCYRIDLSNTINKYVGETEKNLSRIFDAAQTAGAVLLFDEADALFGKRGEVKEARDRYANQEVSYLLQRMETYPGLAILTSNLPSTIDSAFERRLKFIVKFPFPTPEQQRKIWERIFPSQAPTKNLDYAKLIWLSATGGTIANLALDAMFRASREGGPIEMRHIKEAALAEKEKTGLRVPEGVYHWE